MLTNCCESGGSTKVYSYINQAYEYSAEYSPPLPSLPHIQTVLVNQTLEPNNFNISCGSNIKHTYTRSPDSSSTPTRQGITHELEYTMYS